MPFSLKNAGLQKDSQFDICMDKFRTTNAQRMLSLTYAGLQTHTEQLLQIAAVKDEVAPLSRDLILLKLRFEGLNLRL